MFSESDQQVALTSSEATQSDFVAISIDRNDFLNLATNIQKDRPPWPSSEIRLSVFDRDFNPFDAYRNVVYKETAVALATSRPGLWYLMTRENTFGAGKLIELKMNFVLTPSGDYPWETLGKRIVQRYINLFFDGTPLVFSRLNPTSNDLFLVQFNRCYKINPQVDTGNILSGFTPLLETSAPITHLVLDDEDQIYAVINQQVVRIRKASGVVLEASTKGGGFMTRNLPDGLYPVGTEVELTATPKDGWQFLHWTNSISGTQNPVKITLDRHRSVEAVFGAPLTLEVNGDGHFYT